MNNLMKLLVLSMLIYSVSSSSVADDHALEEGTKVCAITLKGKKQTIEDEISKYSCVKGDILYITEVQVLGMTQHTVAMNAARVCEMESGLHSFALQYTITASCKYSGQILPIVGDRKTLRMGDLDPPKEKKKKKKKNKT